MRPSVAIIGTRGYPSYYGGFETAVRYLAPALADKGWGVTVYGRPHGSKPDDALRDARIQSRTTWGIDSKSLSTLTYGLTASLAAAHRKPDVALVMNVANGFWLPFLRARGIPALVNVDGVEWDRAKWGGLAKRVFHSGARLTAKYGTRMVYDSREIQLRWASEFKVPGDFIPYGGSIPPKLPLEPGLAHRRYVLVVARFVPENTIPEFFEAATILGTEFDVVIVGSSGYGGRLDSAAEALAKRDLSVRYLGHVSDDLRLSSLWQHAGAYFHGHSVGGTNPALVQAMACGAPIVARDTVYNREVLGTTGLFVEPDPEAIASGIRMLMQAPKMQQLLSTSAVSRATNYYSWNEVCESYERSLASLIGVNR